MNKLLALSLLLAGVLTVSACTLQSAPPATQPQTSFLLPPRPEPLSARDKTRLALEEKVKDLVVESQPIEKVMAFLRDASSLNIVVNWATLEAAGVDRNTPVTLNLREVPLRAALTTVLSSVSGGTANLGYAVDDDGIVEVSTLEDLNSYRHLVVRVYEIRFLFTPEHRSKDEAIRDLIDTIKTTVCPETWRDAGGQIGNLREIYGQLVIMQTRSNHDAIRTLLDQIEAASYKRVQCYDVRDIVGDDADKLHRLMNLIEDLSNPSTWKEKGGYAAAMRGVDGRIYITGHQQAHDEITHLLKKFRENQTPNSRWDVTTPDPVKTVPTTKPSSDFIDDKPPCFPLAPR